MTARDVSNDAATWQSATRVVRAGLPEKVAGTPYLPGPVFAAPYHTPGDPLLSPYTYGRFHNPSWTHYEAALAEMEGGPCLLFPSGMAATAAVLATLVPPGSTLVMPQECYYTTRVIASQPFPGAWFASQGIKVVMAPTAGDGLLRALEQEAAHGVAMLWLETPTNPGLDVCDIALLAAKAHEVGALVAVDNTTATPLLQQPLALGADVCVVSDTKAMTGHADLVLGHVAVRDAQHAEQLRLWRTRMGVIPGPMEAWLAHRSLGTLHVRLMQQCRSAMAIAEFLSGCAQVSGVRYPGLPNDPSHAIAAKQMKAFGGVVSFELPSAEAVAHFFAHSRLVYEATSFGGLHTSAERRARWGGDAVSDGFVRMSVGLEDVHDLIADLTTALARL
ncbi:cystathionine gamma-lyase [Gemmatimonas phototrophica]|uniref:Cystathionine gamma-lyase n=1 Tax=Gemmatimonas phototrophica TaxID=1379270 RepID=A0A143BHA9_9BACT|nr:cystathionine gamma-lyase [Gemmatimonas phototrophica]AMW03892.1 cystathionine gamma-lyase [Gemmatimonas phototrophica]